MPACAMPHEEHANQSLPVQQRFGDDSSGACVCSQSTMGIGRLLIVIHHEPLPLLGGGPDDAFAKADLQLLDPLAQVIPGPRTENLGLLVPEMEAPSPSRPDEDDGPLDDQMQEGRKMQLAGELTRDLPY